MFWARAGAPKRVCGPPPQEELFSFSPKRSNPMFRYRFLLLIAVFFSATLIAYAAEPALVTIDLATLRQMITGFGASGGNDSAENFAKLSPENQQKLYDLLFDAEIGIGLSMLRSELFYRIEASSGAWDWSKDEAQVRVMIEAKKRGVKYFWSACWSPPAWMKDTHDVNNGGHLLPEYYQAYAEMLSRYVREYKERFGIEIQAVSIINEPEVKAKYQSCLWSGAQLRDFIKNNLGPTFARDHVTAQIMLPETSSWEHLETYADPVMADPEARRFVGIIAAHQYNQTFVSEKQPKYPPATPLLRYTPAEAYGKQLWETEVSFIGGTPDASMNWGTGTALLIHNALVGAEVNAWTWWAMLSTWNDNESLADLRGDSFIPTKRLFALGNFSKFVRPGFRMTAATHAPKPGVHVTSFRDPATGRFAIVVINDNTTDVSLHFDVAGLRVQRLTPWVTSSTLDLVKQAEIPVSGGAFEVTLPAKSVTTYEGTGTAL
jgi:glucuronoarabinoxylan endo-1,4-beta-xylanase